MKTPSEYTKNLKEKTITKPMLSDALYSVNKRAKNWRDKKRQYNRALDYYHNEEKAEANEKAMYDRKEKLLSVLTPYCIHSEPRFDSFKVYSNEKRFGDQLLQALLDGSAHWFSSYIERTNGGRFGYDDSEYYDCDDFEDFEGKTIYFFSKYLPTPNHRYYLYYPFGDHSYHTPIAEEELKQYPDLPVVDIGEIVTTGDDVSDLMSVQFVDKIIELIDSGEYTLVGCNITELDNLRNKKEQTIVPAGSYPELSYEEKYRIEAAKVHLQDLILKQVQTCLKEKSKVNVLYDLTEAEKKEIENTTFNRFYDKITSKRFRKKAKNGADGLLREIEKMRHYKPLVADDSEKLAIDIYVQSGFSLSLCRKLQITTIRGIAEYLVENNTQTVNKYRQQQSKEEAKKQYFNVHKDEWLNEALIQVYPDLFG